MCIHEGKPNCKLAGSCLYVITRVEYMLVRGYLYPQPLLHSDGNTPTYPEYSSNILGRRSFYRLECTICLLYPIRDRYASPKVLFDLRRSAEPRGLPQTFGRPWCLRPSGHPSGGPNLRWAWRTSGHASLSPACCTTWSFSVHLRLVTASRYLRLSR